MGDAGVEGIIAGHMAMIGEAVRRAAGDDIACVALTGGFGRGEGGVAPQTDGALWPANDYDLLVVLRGDALWTWWRVRARLKELEPALSRACRLRVDFACKTPAMLRRAPHTVEMLECALAHWVLWGDDRVLELIPWRDAAALPASEAVRYLFNRGAALLWSRRMMEDGRPLDEPRARFVQTAIRKAHLAWGDALLLLEGRYTPRYAARPERLASGALPAGLAFIPDIYADAVCFKLQPDFRRMGESQLQAELEESIQKHELVWRWAEGRRWGEDTQRPDFWPHYYARRRPVLRESAGRPGAGEGLFNLMVNLGRLRPYTLAGWMEHPHERLARLLPLLLFLPDEEVPWEAVGRELGVPARRWKPAPRRILSDRFLHVWHPGPPF